MDILRGTDVRGIWNTAGGKNSIILNSRGGLPVL
jgi:hypothetical protein